MRAKFSIGYFWRIASVYVLYLIIFMGVSFAEPGVKITEPLSGTIVHPGDEIVVRIEASEGFKLEEGEVSISPKCFFEEFTNLPVSFTAKIPPKAAGKLHIGVMAFGEPVKFAYAEANLIVQQTATLQSLVVEPNELSVNIDWNGNIKGGYYPYISVEGVYSDGIGRDLNVDSNTTYISSDPSVISVEIDDRGRAKVKVHKVGQAAITVSNSGVSKIIPLVFREPTGLRPLETIPPTTSIDIQPPANSAGWHKTDITITLTAWDNEGGSGIQEVDWRFPGKAKEDYVYSDSAVVTYDIEGIKKFSYWSRDKEGNEDDNKVEIRLDKTPPAITAQALPQPNSLGWNNSDVTVTFTATDTLSGIASVTKPCTITTEGASQAITGEAIDLADNKAAAEVTLNIDRTPPQLMLQLKPVSLSEDHREDEDKKKKEDKENEDEGNWYELIYSATDTLSGLKSLKTGLIIPSLTNYKIESEQSKDLEIRIDENKKELKLKSPNPQEVLTQLQSGLFTLTSGQILQPKLKQGEAKWKIEQKEKGLEIQAPSVILKAEAEDLADNQAVKELEFEKK